MSNIPPAAPASTDCQLQMTDVLGAPLSAFEAFERRLSGRAVRLQQRVRRVLSHPDLMLSRVRHHLAAASRLRQRETCDAPRPETIRRVSLALQPGEWAKVKTIEEITATLDAEGRFAGLSFMPVVMSRFCGRTFPVKKRIDNFFDERRWRMLKSRDVVILDGVFCEPPLEAAADWARCDRTCFLFWSEAWLERASAPRSGERL